MKANEPIDLEKPILRSSSQLEWDLDNLFFFHIPFRFVCVCVCVFRPAAAFKPEENLKRKDKSNET